MSQYKPLADRVILRQEEAETTTASGIVLPGDQEKPQTGTIVAVGPGRVDESGKTISLSVKVGDVVVFSKYGGTEIQNGTDECLIVKESDILAVREK